ncbi:hypothetical protein FACS1894109_16830 [Spirochaetia bacterium]|nr:hypothetical protein FACS1894109_16830 [Spirochaetia bacterium]
MRAYLYAVIQANPEALKEVAMSDLTVEDVLNEAGYIPRWLETGRKEGRVEGRVDVARNALTKGLSVETVSEITGLPLETTRKLAQTSGTMTSGK